MHHDDPLYYNDPQERHGARPRVARARDAAAQSCATAQAAGVARRALREVRQEVPRLAARAAAVLQRCK